MANEPEQAEAKVAVHGRVNFGVYVGRIAGGFAGPCPGVSAGVRVGGSLAPVIGGGVGLVAGVLVRNARGRA